MKTYLDPCESPYSGGCHEPALPGDVLCKNCREWENQHQAKQERYAKEAMDRDFWNEIYKEMDQEEAV